MAKQRLVTRSDFDGLVCAILLKELNMIDEIVFVHPKDMQDGKIPITDRDITTNLPYVPGVGMAFDHHSSEVLRNPGEHPNLIVFRSVTKFHGIPGMRVAYAVANSGLASSIADNLPPWPITTLASRAVAAALNDREYVLRTRAENCTRRDMLQRDLEHLGLIVYPAAANFLLFKLPSSINPHAFWENMIVTHKTVLRSCANYEALAPGHFRTAVRLQAENRHFISSLADAIGS